jgi:hypothetical protein
MFSAWGVALNVTTASVQLRGTKQYVIGLAITVKVVELTDGIKTSYHEEQITTN